MQKITGYPGVVSNHLGQFQDLFSKPQLKHFAEYLTGLIVCDKINIKQINNAFIQHGEYSNKDRFLTTSDWPIEKVNQRRIELIRKKVEPLNRSKGCLIIDDSFLEKTGKHIPEVGIFYDPAQHRYILAHNLVTSHYVTPGGSFPIGHRLYLKRDKNDQEYQSKIEAAKELVDEAVAAGLIFQTVVFDAWYLCKELCKHIETKGLAWLGVAKSNRIVYDHGRRMSLKEFRQTLVQADFKKVTIAGKVYYCFTKTIKMSKLGKVRVLISHEKEDLSDDPFYLATNNLRWESRRILTEYANRWLIETFYRDSKQNLGLGDYAMRDLQAIKRHWYLVFLSYTLLSLSSMDGMLRNWFNANVKTIGEKCRCAAVELFQDFTFWLIKKLKEQRTVDEIMNIIFSPKGKLGERFQMA
jgi:SRSO17 transposase